MDESFLVKKNTQKEEKKKKGLFFVLGKRVRSGRFAFLLVAFLFTLVGLSMSTYAWFTSNFTVSVQEIDVNVSSGSGIQISTNAKDWKSLITLDDITTNKYAEAVNQLPGSSAQINPVSTVADAYAAATDASQGLKMFRGTIVNDVQNGTMYLDSVQQTDSSTGGDYVAFDLFLKLDFSSDKQVYLTSNTGITGGSPNTFIEYAGRMGFVVNGHTSSSDTVAHMTALKGATDVLIYEPNYDVHTANGLTNGRDNYDITGYTATGNASAVPYYGVISEFAYDGANSSTGTILKSTEATKFKAVTPTLKTTSGNTERTAFLTLSPGVTKIRVYMWIEGQDIDCENTASGGQVKFQLGFTVDE